MGWYESNYPNATDREMYSPSKPGNIGGIEPDPKTMAEPPGPRVIEVEGTDETDVERGETAKQGDAVSPVATDDEMYEVNAANHAHEDPSNFRESSNDSLAAVFWEWQNRGPSVIADEGKEEE